MNASTQSPENMDSILRRVEKLLAIAQDDRANPAEAAAAAGMAERIMRKYQIDQSEIIISALKRGDDMEEVRCVAKGRVASTDCKITIVPQWAQFLATKIAKLNETNVKIKRDETGEAGVVFQGFGADAKLAGFTFHYLVGATNRLCLAFRNTPEFKVMGRTGAHSYRTGVVMGILRSLEEQISAKFAEVAATSNGRALVVAKTNAVAERFGEQRTKNAKVTTRAASAFSAGVRDGKAVDVNTRGIGTNGPSSSTLRLK